MSAAGGGTNLADDRDDKLSICVLALNAYNVLSANGDLRHIGGAEVQIVTLARGLAEQGHRVTFVTLDHGQPDGQDCDGIRVYKAYASNAGIRVLRFVHPRCSGLWRALSLADPDVVLQPSAEYVTGVAAAWCRRHQRRLAFVVMSDADCDTRLPFLERRQERVLYRYGLRRTDCVAAQTDAQRRRLSENFGIDSEVIRPCCLVPDDQAGPRDAPPGPPYHLVWIGRFVPDKRLEWFLDVGDALSDVHCDVVGDANEPTDYSRAATVRAEGMPNVTLHGFLPYDRMPEVYGRAALLVCTSRLEGYPTIFMEAWGRGIPIVTTFDPDGVVAASGAGRAVSDVDGAIAAVNELLHEPGRWAEASRRSYGFFAENHALDAVVPRYESLLLRATEREGRSS